jgi:hypothetical protein
LCQRIHRIAQGVQRVHQLIVVIVIVLLVVVVIVVVKQLGFLLAPRREQAVLVLALVAFAAAAFAALAGQLASLGSCSLVEPPSKCINVIIITIVVIIFIIVIIIITIAAAFNLNQPYVGILSRTE